MNRQAVALTLSFGFLATGPAAADWVNSKLNEDTTSQLQNEQQVVVNPANPSNLVAVWRDFRLGYRQVGYAYTNDGGQSWSNPGLFVDTFYPRDSDPALTVNNSGDFFAVLLGYTGSTSEENGMLCYRSQDGGQTWEFRGFPVNQVPNVFEDKEFVACDRTGGLRDGNLYVVWDRFFETNIYSVTSTDDGANWSNEVRVSDESSNQFPTPAVGTNGELYVAWTYFGGSIRFDRSTNGGLTFGSDIPVTQVNNPHPSLNGGIESPAHPAMDVDITGGAFDGRIYIAYLDRVSSQDYDIYIRHSDDQGSTWSSRRRVNDDAFSNGRDQFHPWLTVDNTGTVTVVFLDRRHDPSNLSWHCYIAQSTDGGITFGPNQQVSTQASHPADVRMPGEIDYDADREAKIAAGPSLPGWLRRSREARGEGAANTAENGDPLPDNDPLRAGTIGEYIGVASWNGYATTVWTDTRNGHQDTYGGAEDVSVSVGEVDGAVTPARLRAAPNPAQGPVTLNYDVVADGFVSLEVYDVNGRRLRTLVGRNLRSGSYRFVWDGTNQVGEAVAPGAYWVRFQAAGVEETASVRIHP